MTPDTYIQEVLKTESSDLSYVRRRLYDDKVLRLLHAAQGMVTEAGEMMDALKKHLFYGKPLDEVNLMEELGDSLWYTAVAIDALNTSFEEIMGINIRKLRKRYGEKFNSEKAVERDLGAEREILEGKEKVDDFRDHTRVGPPFVSYEEGKENVTKGFVESRLEKLK